MTCLRSSFVAFALSLLSGCEAGEPATASPRVPDPPAGVPHPVGTAASPRPAAGADLDPALVARLIRAEAEGSALASATAPAPGVSLDLGADRPAVAIAVPRVPRAATARFDFADGKRGWITRLPVGQHLPSAAYGGGRVYVSGGFDTTAFYALDAEDGRLLWNRQDLEDNGPTAAMFQGGEVVFNTESCTLFVLDARTGRTRWRRWLGDPTLAQPALAEGLIFASHPVRGGGHALSALRLRDGTPAWSRPLDGELLAAPVVAEQAVYAATIHGTVYRFANRSGARRWARSIRASTAPWIAGGRVFLSRTAARGEELVALDAESGRSLATLRRVNARYLADIPRDLQSWPKVWAFEGSRPILAHGRLIDTMAGTASAADPRSGRSLWQRRHPGTTGQRSLFPPVLAGSQIVLASREGGVYALDLDTGMTVWAYRTGRPIASSPIVARGWVYLASTDGTLIGLEVGGPALDGWHMWGGGPGHNG
jgi:Ca-activated chloride channel family protein